MSERTWKLHANACEDAARMDAEADGMICMVCGGIVADDGCTDCGRMPADTTDYGSGAWMLADRACRRCGEVVVERMTLSGIETACGCAEDL